MSPNSQVKKEVTVQQSGRKGEVLLYKEKQSCCSVQLGFSVIYGYTFASSPVRYQSQVRKATNIYEKCEQVTGSVKLHTGDLWGNIQAWCYHTFMCGPFHHITLFWVQFQHLDMMTFLRLNVYPWTPSSTSLYPWLSFNIHFCVGPHHK